jgi:hypothetical protein
MMREEEERRTSHVEQKSIWMIMTKKPISKKSDDDE